MVRVGIKGLAPGLLMHNPASATGRHGKKPKTCSHGNGLDAKCVPCLEACTYRDTEGGLCIPSVALHGCIINAASRFKIGKKAATPLISGVLRVRPFEVPLTVPGAPFHLPDVSEKDLDYQIDTRWTVIARQRVIGHRPWIPGDWTANFYLVFDPAYLTDEGVLQEIVSVAGRSVGVLDFRPQHRGPFGTFVVTEWAEAGNGEGTA